MEYIEALSGAAALQTGHSLLVLGVLLGCSLWCVALGVERWLYFRRIRTNPEEALLRIRGALEAGRIEDALAILGPGEGDPVLAVIRVGVRNSRLAREQVTELMRAAQTRQRAAMERSLGALGTLGNTAPFIGLLGTVLGIIQAFRDLAAPHAQADGAGVVAVGIAEALVATAAGLVVAIPAVVLYNYFLKQVRRWVGEMEVTILEMSVLLGSKPSAEAGHADTLA